MTMDPALKNLLVELGDHLLVGDMTFDADAGCALRFGDRMTVNLQYRPADDVFYLYADLGAPPPCVEIYRDLLAANLFWEGASGATLSLSGDDPPHVVLAQSFGWRGKTGAQFGGVVSTFANVAQDWSEMLSGETEAGARAPSPEAAEMVGLLRV
jgi:hypothetical protein